jgi:hypothetical protein
MGTRLSRLTEVHLTYKSSVDPFVFVADASVAGLGQARNTNPGFGQEAEGYFKRFAQGLRRACVNPFPNSVPQGRLRIVQDWFAAYFQPSLRDLVVLS